MLTRFAVLASLVLSCPSSLSAQRFPDSSRYAGSLSFGTFRYDLPDAGKTGLMAARVERPLSRYAVAEAGIIYARPERQGGERTHFWAPEIQVQLQLPFRIMAPYFGIGGGVAYDSGHRPATTRSGLEPQPRHRTDPTLSAAAGARVWFTGDFGARTELRVRGVGGDFVGSSTEWTLGLALRL